MAQILPRDLTAVPGGIVNPNAAVIVDDGSGVWKATPEQVAASGAPISSQPEAEAGVVNTGRMTPLRVKQAIDALGVSQDVLASSIGASMMGYLLNATDAVARTAEDKLSDAINAKDFGVTADGVTDDKTALQAAINYMVSNNVDKLVLPRGEIKLSGDVTVPPHTGTTDYNRSVTLVGQGAGANGTFLHFASGSLIVQASSHYLADFQVTSDDTNGIEIKPTVGPVKYPARSMIQNVSAYDCAESGITIEDCWIHTMINVMARRNGKYGLEGKAGANFSTACNAWTIIGGELQGNGAIGGAPTGGGGADKSTGGGLYTGRGVQVVLLGVTIEGNVGDGLIIAEQLRGISVLGCYFEKNGANPLDRDIRNASPSNPVFGPNSGFILNCNFTPQALNGTVQDRAIELYDFADLKIVNPQFFEEGSAGAYSAEPIRVRETAAGRCSGWIDGGFYLSSGYTQKLLKNDCERFGFPRKHVFSRNHVLAKDTQANTISIPFVVPMTATCGTRMTVNHIIGPGTWNTGAASGGNLGVARIVTTIRRGMTGTTVSTKTNDVNFASSVTAINTPNDTSNASAPGTFALVTVARDGTNVADTLSVSATLLALEVIVYEGVVSARGLA